MYARIRLKLKSKKLAEMNIELPKDLKDYSDDTINDAVSDILDEKGVYYKWYRVLKQ